MFKKFEIHFFLKTLLKVQLGIILIISILLFYTKDERNYSSEQEKFASVIKPLFTSNSNLLKDPPIDNSTQSLTIIINYINSFCSNISQNKSVFLQQNFSNKDIALTKLEIENQIKQIDRDCNSFRAEIQNLGDYINLDMEAPVNKNILENIKKETDNMLSAYREIVNLSKLMLEKPEDKFYPFFKFLQNIMIFNLLLLFIMLCLNKANLSDLETYYRNKFRLAIILATLSLSFYLIFNKFMDISLIFPLFSMLFFLQSLFYASRYSRCI